LSAPAATATSAAPRRLDVEGRYRCGGVLSGWTIGVYVLLILALYYVLQHSAALSYPEGIYAVVALTVFFLVRYLSTTYTIDDAYLRAFRIAGGRKIRLEDIRKIEYASLRELSPTGFFGSWGWRGRMWSPVLGPFDAIYTDSKGLLLTAGEAPLFLSPRHPQEFARELSRRVRSYTGPLPVDVGRPGSGF
jgi:hypothetical protein